MTALWLFIGITNLAMSVLMFATDNHVTGLMNLTMGVWVLAEMPA